MWRRQERFAVATLLDRLLSKQILYTDPVSENRHRRPRLSGLLTALVMVPVMLVVPASLPLCAMEIDACAVDVPVVPAGAHCPMDAAGLGAMPCCVSDAAPQGPAPAAPGKADADLRVQLKAPAPVAAPAHAFLAAPSEAAQAPSPTAAPAAPAVPLYTLLSTLLN